MVARKQGRPNLAAMLDGIGEEKKEIPAPEPEIKKEILPARIAKIKRCYTITDQQLENLITIKAKIYRGKDMSEIVGMAIDFLYKDLFAGEKE